MKKQRNVTEFQKLSDHELEQVGQIICQDI